MLALKRCSSFLESSCTFSCPFESERAVPDRAYVCPYFVSGFLLLKSRTKLEPARLPTSARSSTIFAINAESTVNILRSGSRERVRWKPSREDATQKKKAAPTARRFGVFGLVCSVFILAAVRLVAHHRAWRLGEY